MNVQQISEQISWLFISVMILQFSALYTLRAFTKMIQHKLSFQSAASCVWCCSTVVGDDVEAKTEIGRYRQSGLLINTVCGRV